MVLVPPWVPWPGFLSAFTTQVITSSQHHLSTTGILEMGRCGYFICFNEYSRWLWFRCLSREKSWLNHRTKHAPLSVDTFLAYQPGELQKLWHRNHCILTKRWCFKDLSFLFKYMLRCITMCAMSWTEWTGKSNLL